MKRQVRVSQSNLENFVGSSLGLPDHNCAFSATTKEESRNRVASLPSDVADEKSKLSSFAVSYEGGIAAEHKRVVNSRLSMMCEDVLCEIQSIASQVASADSGERLEVLNRNSMIEQEIDARFSRVYSRLSGSDGVDCPIFISLPRALTRIVTMGRRGEASCIADYQKQVKKLERKIDRFVVESKQVSIAADDQRMVSDFQNSLMTVVSGLREYLTRKSLVHDEEDMAEVERVWRKISDEQIPGFVSSALNKAIASLTQTMAASTNRIDSCFGEIERGNVGKKDTTHEKQETNDPNTDAPKNHSVSSHLSSVRDLTSWLVDESLPRVVDLLKDLTTRVDAENASESETSLSTQKSLKFKTSAARNQTSQVKQASQVKQNKPASVSLVSVKADPARPANMSPLSSVMPSLASVKSAPRSDYGKIQQDMVNKLVELEAAAVSSLIDAPTGDISSDLKKMTDSVKFAPSSSEAFAAVSSSPDTAALENESSVKEAKVKLSESIKLYFENVKKTLVAEITRVSQVDDKVRQMTELMMSVSVRLSSLRPASASGSGLAPSASLSASGKTGKTANTLNSSPVASFRSFLASQLKKQCTTLGEKSASICKEIIQSISAPSASEESITSPAFVKKFSALAAAQRDELATNLLTSLSYLQADGFSGEVWKNLNELLADMKTITCPSREIQSILDESGETINSDARVTGSLAKISEWARRSQQIFLMSMEDSALFLDQTLAGFDLAVKSSTDKIQAEQESALAKFKSDVVPKRVYQVARTERSIKASTESASRNILRVIQSGFDAVDFFIECDKRYQKLTTPQKPRDYDPMTKESELEVSAPANTGEAKADGLETDAIKKEAQPQTQTQTQAPLSDKEQIPASSILHRELTLVERNKLRKEYVLVVNQTLAKLAHTLDEINTNNGAKQTQDEKVLKLVDELKTWRQALQLMKHELTQTNRLASGSESSAPSDALTTNNKETSSENKPTSQDKKAISQDKQAVSQESKSEKLEHFVLISVAIDRIRALAKPEPGKFDFLAFPTAITCIKVLKQIIPEENLGATTILADKKEKVQFETPDTKDETDQAESKTADSNTKPDSGSTIPDSESTIPLDKPEKTIQLLKPGLPEAVLACLGTRLAELIRWNPVANNAAETVAKTHDTLDPTSATDATSAVSGVSFSPDSTAPPTYSVTVNYFAAPEIKQSLAASATRFHKDLNKIELAMARDFSEKIAHSACLSTAARVEKLSQDFHEQLRRAADTLAKHQHEILTSNAQTLRRKSIIVDPASVINPKALSAKFSQSVDACMLELKTYFESVSACVDSGKSLKSISQKNFEDGAAFRANKHDLESTVQEETEKLESHRKAVLDNANKTSLKVEMLHSRVLDLIQVVMKQL